ncbi:MAG: BrnT family toxin [Caldilineaceae bacterium]
MQYNFEWDPQKDRLNKAKYEVSFRLAATVFRDQNQLSVYDDEHSDHEDRWATIGLDSGGILRVIIHTFEQVEAETIEIRIISACKATREESEQYYQGL